MSRRNRSRETRGPEATEPEAPSGETEPASTGEESTSEQAGGDEKPEGDTEATEPEAKPTAKPKTSTYHVVGDGAVSLGKGRARKTYRAGDAIELTDEDAESLGDLIAKGPPPPPPVPRGERKAGRYRVLSGRVVSGREAYGPDERDSDGNVRDVVALGEKDARTLEADLEFVS